MSGDVCPDKRRFAVVCRCRLLTNRVLRLRGDCDWPVVIFYEWSNNYNN
jgi:hypothetical protein